MGGRRLKETFQDSVSESNYDARTNYLSTMKQFMAHTTESIQNSREQNLEDYFLYEKKLSQHIQAMMNHCT